MMWLSLRAIVATPVINAINAIHDEAADRGLDTTQV